MKTHKIYEGWLMTISKKRDSWNKAWLVSPYGEVRRFHREPYL